MADEPAKSAEELAFLKELTAFVTDVVNTRIAEVFPPGTSPPFWAIRFKQHPSDGPVERLNWLLEHAYTDAPVPTER